MNIKSAVFIGVLTTFAVTAQAGYVPGCGHDPGTPGTPTGCFDYAFGGHGKLGATHTFAPAGASNPDITASGFYVNRHGKLSTVDLYSKGSSSTFPPPNDESGLGLTNDPSHDNEITKGSFIMLDLNGLSLSSLYMGSTTDGEEWGIWGSDSKAYTGETFTIPTSGMLTGTTEGFQDVSSLAGDPYIFVTSLKGNVLLGGVTACSSVPEPASAGMLGLALIALALMARKRFAMKPEQQPART